MMDFELKTNEYAASFPEIEIHTKVILPQLSKALSSIDLKTLKEQVISAIYNAYTMYDTTTINTQKKEQKV